MYGHFVVGSYCAYALAVNRTTIATDRRNLLFIASVFKLESEGRFTALHLKNYFITLIGSFAKLRLLVYLAEVSGVGTYGAEVTV